MGAKKQLRRAARLAQAAAKAARYEAALRSAEDVEAARIESELASAAAAAADQNDGAPAPAAAPFERLRERRRALLIINSKSGPKHDSLLRVREIVGLLATHGVDAEVRVKLRKKQARRDAARAVEDGYPLVIAAGGDGTVEAVASGLAGRASALGIIPLGTYNNVATCLGIPTDVAEACALAASGAVRAVDVGYVRAKHKKKPRMFLELAAVGLTAALMPAGQEAKKGEWGAVRQALPHAFQLSPVDTRVTLDGGRPVRQATTLLVEIANAPRMGPALDVAPESRMDDGLLDVAIHHDAGQAGLLARMVALKAAGLSDGDDVERARARVVQVKTARPLPVMADSKVWGTTPARFDVVPGALLVVAGSGPALSRPVSPTLVAALREEAHVVVPTEPNEPDPIPAVHGESTTGAVAASIVPGVAAVAAAGGKARALALPTLAGAVGAAALPLLRLLAHRLRG